MSTSDILHWAGETGVAVTLLIVFVLLIRRPFARVLGAGAAYSLWSLPAIRLFLPEFQITLPAAISERISASQITSQPEIITHTISGPPLITPLTPAPVPFQMPWGDLLIAAWLGGALIWLTYHVWNHRQITQTLRRDSRTLPGALESVLYEARRQIGLKRQIEVRLSSAQTGPLVVGLFKPLIILPQSFMTDYTRRQQLYALAHELAHIKRGDLWMAMAGLLFRAINWPNPLIHFAARKFRADQEAACDAYVLGRLGGTDDIRKGYAETLIHAARSTVPGTPVPLGLTIYHPLKERLMTLKTSNKKAGLPVRLLAGVCLVGALAMAAPFNVASAGDETVTAKVHNKMEGKQVIKWVEENDGQRSEKHYEILSEDGQKTAYKIGKDGSRTEVPMSEVEDMQGMAGLPDMPGIPEMPDFGDDIDVFIMQGDDGEEKKVVKKRIKKMRNGQHTQMGHHSGDHQKVIVKRMGAEGQNGDMKVFAYSSDDNMTVDIQGDGYAYGESGSHSKMMVNVAKDMLDNVKDDDMSDKTKRKIDKARKALKEAQEALEAEK